MSSLRIAVLDDYQKVALSSADWSPLAGRATVTVFDDHIVEPEALVRRLEPFDILCVMRERTPLPEAVIERLPRLKLIASTGPRNSAIASEAAARRGITVMHTHSDTSAAVELTWGLILSSVRRIAAENEALRAGLWQRSVGLGLKGKTLSVLGLGRIGASVTRIGLAFGMEVVAWSPNLTAEKASAEGCRLVSKEDAFRLADILTIHLVLGERSRALVGAAELALMKPGAVLVNTARGPIVDEAALVATLRDRRIGGAALDVFDIEPLPASHPFRTFDNVLATPHIGYVTQDLYGTFYGETVDNIVSWLKENAP